MPAKLPSRAILEITAALAIAIGTGVIVTRPTSSEAPQVDKSTGRVPPDAAPPIDAPDHTRVDVKAYSAVMRAALQDAGIDVAHGTDVLSEPVAPGQDVTTYVNVPLGSRPTDFDLVGESAGKFMVKDIAFSDGQSVETRGGRIPADTIIRITAHNTSAVTVRLNGIVHYNPPSSPPDGGP